MKRRLLWAVCLLLLTGCGGGGASQEDLDGGGNGGVAGNGPAATGGRGGQQASGGRGLPDGGAAAGADAAETGDGGRGGEPATGGKGGGTASEAGGTGGSPAGTGGTAGVAGFAGDTGRAGETGGSGGAAGGSASSPAVRIVGRTGAGGTNGSATEYAWPGVNIQARFMGTAVSMVVSNATGNNRITVVVDGGTPKVVALASGQSTVSLASGLTDGAHDLLIWRNTEASPGGVTTFTGLTGFGNGGGLLAPDAAPSKRIEVIGDSLSVGAGVQGDSTCTGGIDAFTDNYLAYGSVAARAVSADVVTIAYSGIGVYRNYGETTPTATSLTMPKRYPYAIPDTVLWNFALYQPQVVIINLGTNDFGSGDPGTPYEAAYVAFVQTIRQRYPTAYFILIDMYGGNRLTRLKNVLTDLKNGGESMAEILSFGSVQNNLGCNQHPNVAGQQAMGTTLAARLHALFGW
jgi:lysophospholipase L1-like esterase